MSRIIRRLFGRSPAPARVPRRRVRRAADLNARLLVHGLEERAVPATFTVTSAADAGTGSLRAAVAAANVTGGADAIVFNTNPSNGTDFSTPQTISLLSALPAVTDAVTITGPGAALLAVRRDPAAASSFRVFTFNNTTAFSATLSGMTITGGQTAGTAVGTRGGGGIAIGGTETVTVADAVVTGNTAAGEGGGINVGIGGRLTVRNSTVSGNVAGTGDVGGNNAEYSGGGIYFAAGGQLVMEASTVSGNSAAAGGGGMYFYGGSYGGGNFGSWTVRNSTVSGNTAGGVGGGIYLKAPAGTHAVTVQNSTIAQNVAFGGGVGPGGGGIAQVGGGAGGSAVVTITGSIVANNAATSGAGADVLTDPTAPMVVTYSLIHDQSGTPNLALDATDTPANPGTGLTADPLLGPFGDYGGPPAPAVHTLMYSLQAGSPAIDHGTVPAGVSEPYDQRGPGFSRSVGQPDMGSYEFLPPGTPTASGAFADVTGGSSYSFTVVYTATAAGAQIATAGNLNTGDILVTGPNFYNQVATFISASPGGTAGQQTATYSITPPGASWGVNDYGTYTIAVQASQVQDTQGHFVPAGTVGTFQVLTPATFVVTNTADTTVTTDPSYPGSLRWAIGQANARTGTADVITFDPTVFATAQTLSLAAVTLNITDSVSVNGPAAGVTLQGQNANQLINVNGAGVLNVTLDHLTLTGGRTGTTSGAAIGSADENLTITNCVITGNTTVGSTARSGAGVAIGTDGSLTVRNSTISGNSARGRGGAIYFANGGTLLVDSSTVSGNTAGSLRGGGGIFFQGSAAAGGFTVRNSTIAGNSASSGGGIALRYFTGNALIQDTTVSGNTAGFSGGSPYYAGGGGIAKFYLTTSGTITLQNSIVAGNSSSAANFDPDIATNTPNGTIADHSLIGVVDQFVQLAPSSANNQSGTDAAPLDPKLGPLANNGGPTQTMLPQPSSPAINHGTAVAGVTTDQRGAARSVGQAPDIGSVETADTGLVATGGAITDVTSLSAPTAYQFTVTYQSSGTINTATFDSNDVTVTPPAGLPAPTVSEVGFSAPYPNLVIAYYQFTAPGGAWTAADNGVYTLTSKAGQVSDLNGVSSPADRVIGSLQARVPIVVTNTNDDTNPGSLRWALGVANAVYGTADTIVFNTYPPAGTDFSQPQTITLTSGAPLVSTDSVSIVGPGAGLLTISGNHATRVFNLAGNGVLNEAFSGLTISNGSAAAGTAGGAVSADNEIVTLSDCRVTGNASAGAGGGIGMGYYGNLVLRNCTVAGNSAATQGGGVNLAGGGNLTVDHSTLSGNTAGGGLGGGGIYFFGNAGSFASNAGLTPNGLTVTDSTLSGNTSATDGGGVEVYQSYSTFTVQNSTIAFNSAGGNGGGLSAAPNGTAGAATFAVSSSIVARNAAGGAGPDVNNVVAGGASGPVVADHSLIGVADAGFVLVDGGGNLTGTSAAPLDPLLGPLTNNGGPTQTYALLPGSPALNAGVANGLTTDQRGLLRTFGSAPDMGSFEEQAPTVASVAVNGGAVQRSEVRSIVVTFSGPVTFTGGNANAAAAFQLLHTTYGSTVYNTQVANLQAAVSTNGSGQTVVTLTFTTTGNAPTEVDPLSVQSTAGGPTTPSLGDGKFQLTIFASHVSSPDGQLAGDNSAAGTNYVSPAETPGAGSGIHLWRLFGDATGNGIDDLSDLTIFRNTYNTALGNPAYLNYMDADNDGVIDLDDLTAFRNHYNHTV
jgi:hypothetical protein